MLRNYLKIAIRNLVGYKLHTFINLIGLTVGLSCFIVIVLWIKDEFSYDRTWENSDRIYQLTIDHPNHIKDPNVPFILPSMLATEYSEISKFTRFVRLSDKATCSFSYSGVNGRQISFNESDVILVDSTFFSIFSNPFLYGDKNSALSEGSSVVISSDIAQKYFGNTNPIGRILTLNNQVGLAVTGVFENSGKSHLKFEILIPIPLNQYSNWNWSDPSYILTSENVDIAHFKNKIADFFNQHHPYNFKKKFTLSIMPISKSYLGFGRMKYIYLSSVVALFLLIVAGINYVNLSTANFSKRAKEMMVRKVAGANRRQLIFQLLGESIIKSIGLIFCFYHGRVDASRIQQILQQIIRSGIRNFKMAYTLFRGYIYNFWNTGWFLSRFIFIHKEIVQYL